MKTRNQSMVTKFLGALLVVGILLPINSTIVALMPQVTLATGKHNQIAGNYLLHRHRHPRIRIKINDLDTGKSIKRYDTLFDETKFQVTVMNYGADCAGQFGST